MEYTVSRVFVVQENSYVDYSDAERYGEVVFMTADEFRPMDNSLRNRQIIDQVRGAMLHFTPDDFLILTGNPTIIGYAFYVAMSKFDSVNVLQWDKIAREYRAFTFRG